MYLSLAVVMHHLTQWSSSFCIVRHLANTCNDLLCWSYSSVFDTVAL